MTGLPAPIWRYCVMWEDARGPGNSFIPRTGPISSNDDVRRLGVDVNELVGRPTVLRNWILLGVDGLDFHGMPIDPDYAGRAAFEAWVGPGPGPTVPWDELPEDARTTWRRVAADVLAAHGGLPAAF